MLKNNDGHSEILTFKLVGTNSTFVLFCLLKHVSMCFAASISQM